MCCDDCGFLILKKARAVLKLAGCVPSFLVFVFMMVVVVVVVVVVAGVPALVVVVVVVVVVAVALVRCSVVFYI